MLDIQNILKRNIMDEFEWSVVNEGHLLDAMVGHKPIGINKHFQMAFICEKFTKAINKEIPSSRIWTHLETMYNLEALNEHESLPFPNDEREFVLPDGDFATLKKKKEKDEQEEKKTQKGRETPKNLKEVKEVKKEEVKPPARNAKSETPRRDSKDKDKDTAKETKPQSAKKEAKKEPERTKPKRNSLAAVKEEAKKNNKREREESPRPTKRPTRGSLKPDESNGGKASPLTVPPATKRRRI